MWKVAIQRFVGRMLVNDPGVRRALAQVPAADWKTRKGDICRVLPKCPVGTEPPKAQSAYQGWPTLNPEPCDRCMSMCVKWWFPLLALRSFLFLWLWCFRDKVWGFLPLNLEIFCFFFALAKPQKKNSHTVHYRWHKGSWGNVTVTSSTYELSQETSKWRRHIFNHVRPSWIIPWLIRGEWSERSIWTICSS